MLKDLVKKKPTLLLTVKMTDEEMAELKEKAERYADGNISAWVRYSSLKYVPEKKELVKNPA